MDRALKERIIGAVVLVVFVVLVVPVFLDGPAGDAEIVSERVLLPGQEPQDTKVVVLDRERAVPIPTISSTQDATEANVSAEPENPDPEPVPKPEPIVAAAATTSETVDAPAQEAPVAEPVREPQPAAAGNGESSTGMWAVQLGSFSNKDNAEALAASLRAQGYAAFLSKLDSAGKELHRVRIGPQKDRQSAEAMAVRLAKVGHKGQVLPHP